MTSVFRPFRWRRRARQLSLRIESSHRQRTIPCDRSMLPTWPCLWSRAFLVCLWKREVKFDYNLSVFDNPAIADNNKIGDKKSQKQSREWTTLHISQFIGSSGNKARHWSFIFTRFRKRLLNYFVRLHTCIVVANSSLLKKAVKNQQIIIGRRWLELLDLLSSWIEILQTHRSYRLIEIVKNIEIK